MLTANQEIPLSNSKSAARNECHAALMGSIHQLSAPRGFFKRPDDAAADTLPTPITATETGLSRIALLIVMKRSPPIPLEPIPWRSPSKLLKSASDFERTERILRSKAGRTQRNHFLSQIAEMQSRADHRWLPDRY